MKNVIKPLAKSVLIPLRLTTAASAADAGVHKKILGSGNTAPLISNDEMEDIIEISKSLEDSGFLLKGVSETIQNEAKEQKEGFLSMLLGTVGASLLGNILAGKRMNRAGEGFIRVAYGSSIKNRDYRDVEILILPYSLTSFEIQKYYQNEPKFNGVCFRDNLPYKNRTKHM